MAFVREKFPDARDVKEDGPMGVVVVWAHREEAFTDTTMRLWEALNLIAMRHWQYDVCYCSTGFNRNAHSLAINFKKKPEEGTEQK